MPTQIPDTGLRGFLKWARSEYPADIYQQIATQIQLTIPQAFSGYMLGGWRKYQRLGALSEGVPTVDTADAADSTASDPSWSDAISQIIKAATGAYQTVSQQQQQAQIINTQLQQSQNGKKPLPISLSSAGITFGSNASALGTGAILGLVAFLIYSAVRRRR